MSASETFHVDRSTSVVPANERAAILQNPGFGRTFTDHMAVATWSEGRGWHDAKVEGRRPFLLDPACAVLHYAQEIFEGLKAYRADDGGIILFRPEQNARRFNQSAARMAMPELPEKMFIEAIETLVRQDSKWIPDGDATLYLRPFMFASEVFLGVKPASEFIFCVIASPAGSYFSSGKETISLWVSDHLNRAGPGGTGAAKCGGNYAASLSAQAESTRNGCDQVVFLDAVEHRWVNELGGMNIFFVFGDGRMLTPPLTDTILPGITRASIIDLARANGMVVEERPYGIDHWQADAQSGALREVFACGTAAVVAPVGEVKSSSGKWVIGDGRGGPVTERLKSQLIDIQRGRVPGPEAWTRRVNSQ